MSEKEEKKSRGLKSYLFTGLLVTTPLAITIYLFVEIVKYIDRGVTALIPADYNPATVMPYGIPGLGIVVLLVFLVIVGWLSSGFLGNFFLDVLNKMISKLPVISGVYGALKKVFETVLGGNKNSAYRQAVLVQYPRNGLWTIAFITGDVYTRIQKKIKEKLVAIYVPTTPNPTSGFLIFVPKKDIIPLDITVEQAWKIIISTGIVTPDSPEKQQKAMMDVIKKAKEGFKE